MGSMYSFSYMLSWRLCEANSNLKNPTTKAVYKIVRDNHRTKLFYNLVYN